MGWIRIWIWIWILVYHIFFLWKEGVPTMSLGGAGHVLYAAPGHVSCGSWLYTAGSLPIIATLCPPV